MFGGLRLAKPHLSRSPTLSALDRRNRPPIAPHSLASHVPIAASTAALGQKRHINAKRWAIPSA